MLKTVYAIMVSFMMVTLAGMLSGCTAMETLAEGISEKAISGSGLFGYSDVGIDATTKTPKTKFLVVKGKYSSIPEGMEYVEYTEDIDSSIFNSASKTYSRRLVFGSSDKKRADAMLKATVDALKQPYADAEDTPPAAPKEPEQTPAAPATSVDTDVEKRTLTVDGVEYEVSTDATGGFSASVSEDGQVSINGEQK